VEHAGPEVLDGLLELGFGELIVLDEHIEEGRRELTDLLFDGHPTDQAFQPALDRLGCVRVGSVLAHFALLVLD